MCGRVKFLSLVSISVENEQEGQEGPPKLMYRGPGRDEYQNIVDVFDEILNRLDKIEETLSNIQNSN